MPFQRFNLEYYIKYKEDKKQNPISYSLHGNPSEDETEAWLWNLLIFADQYAINGNFLTLFSGPEVLVFSNKPRGSYYRNRTKRPISR